DLDGQICVSPGGETWPSGEDTSQVNYSDELVSLRGLVSTPYNSSFEEEDGCCYVSRDRGGDHSNIFFTRYCNCCGEDYQICDRCLAVGGATSCSTGLYSRCFGTIYF